MPTLYLTEDYTLVRRDSEDTLLVQIPEKRARDGATPAPARKEHIPLVKIDEVVVAKAGTGEAHLALDGFEHTLMGENLSKGCHFSHPGRNGGLRFRSNLDRDWRKCHTMRGSSFCGNRCIALFSFLRRHHSSLFCQGERSYERENLQYDRSVSLARWSCSPLAPLEKRLPT